MHRVLQRRGKMGRTEMANYTRYNLALWAYQGVSSWLILHSYHLNMH